MHCCLLQARIRTPGPFAEPLLSVCFKIAIYDRRGKQAISMVHSCGDTCVLFGLRLVDISQGTIWNFEIDFGTPFTETTTQTPVGISKT